MRLRKSDETTLDPIAERELAAIDATLGGQAVDTSLEDLAQLVRDLRDERPEPGAAFCARLDADVAERLRARSTKGRFAPALAWLRARASRRMLLPAMGAVASVLLAVVVATSLIGGDHRRAGVGSTQLSGKPSTAVEQAAPAQRANDSAGAAGAAPSGGSSSSVEPLVPGRARRVERQASLTLTAPADRVADVSDQVIGVTDQVGGIVVSSSVSSNDSGQGGARFELRVPSARLDDALAKLSKLAHVQSRQQNGQDITGVFVSAGDRLRASLAERQGLLRQLARASTPNETASIRARLRITQGQIASERSELAQLRRRADLSSVSVDIEPSGKQIGGGGAYTPRDALHDAGRILAGAAAVTLVTLAVAAPLAALALLAALGARSARRRRREQALEAS